MSDRFDEDSDGIISSLIEELNLRLRLEEMEENVILSSESRVLGDNGVGNESERCSVIYSCSENEGDDGPRGLGGDDSYVRHSEDDIYLSDAVEVGSSRDGDNFGEEHYENGSNEGEIGSEDLGGGDGYMGHSEDYAYFGDSEEGGNSVGSDDSGEEYYESDSSEDNSSDGFEGDDEASSLFPCPFCYMDIEVRSLCIHFQQEHCVDVRNAVCPLCAGNLDGDVTKHFVVHHRTSMRRRRKLLTPGNSSSTVLGKELSSFLGYSGSSRTLADLPSDILESQDVPLDEFSDVKVMNLSNAESSEPLQDQAQKQELEKQWRRAAFVRELVASTIF